MSRCRSDERRTHRLTSVDTEREGEEDDERDLITNGSKKQKTVTTTESIEFDNGLKLDLSSIDDESIGRNNPRRSIDSDFEAIQRSNSRVGDWQTNFTLVESKVRTHPVRDTTENSQCAQLC